MRNSLHERSLDDKAKKKKTKNTQHRHTIQCHPPITNRGGGNTYVHFNEIHLAIIINNFHLIFFFFWKSLEVVTNLFQ